MRYVFFALLLMITGVANATTMCVHTNSYVATLSISRDGVSYTTDGSGGWTVTMDYNTSSRNTPTVMGYASCNEVTGTANTADATISASTSDVGANCWCGMSLPLVSDWVFLQTYASNAACAAACDATCGNAVKTSSSMRGAMFPAVW